MTTEIHRIVYGNQGRINGNNMFRLDFILENEIQMQRYLDIGIDHINDFSPIFEKISDDFYETQEKIFRASGAFEGRRAWKPLKPKYRQWKLRKVGSKPILTFRGKLRKSLTIKGARGNIHRITEKSMVLGTKVKYAKPHQYGSSRGLPKRKIIDLTEPEKRRFTRIAHEEIYRGFNDATRNAFQRGATIGRR